jgi:hypothetical protein
MIDAVMERKMLPQRREVRQTYRAYDLVWSSDDDDNGALFDAGPTDWDTLTEKIIRRTDVTKPPEYPFYLQCGFIVSAILMICSLVGLVLSPLFSSSDAVLALLITGACGMGALSSVLAKAKRLRGF